MEQRKLYFLGIGGIGMSALCCQMTGSGSATFAIVDEPICAAAMGGLLKQKYRDVFVCKPV